MLNELVELRLDLNVLVATHSLLLAALGVGVVDVGDEELGLERVDTTKYGKYLEARVGPGAGLHIEQEGLINRPNLALDRIWQVLEDALVLHGHLVDLVGAELL